MGNQCSEIYQCGVCFENIDSEMRFGLLSACDHVFCFECLQKWREQLYHTRCPACRRHSELMVPSKRFLTGTAKDRFIQKFKPRPHVNSDNPLTQEEVFTILCLMFICLFLSAAFILFFAIFYFILLFLTFYLAFIWFILPIKRLFIFIAKNPILFTKTLMFKSSTIWRSL